MSISVDAVDDEDQLVSFEAWPARNTPFAIEDVQEIVQVPEHITKIPQAESQAMCSA